MLKTSLRLAWRGLNHLTRLAVVMGIVLVIAGSVLVINLRYWVLPDIERYHDDITSVVSEAIGLPVTIGKVEADWRGVRPHLLFTDVRLYDWDNRGKEALALQHVEGVVSWRTLIWGGLRFYSLELDQPDLQVRRDKQGTLYIAGVPLSDKSSGQGGLANWLLHQTYISVRDARVTWQDDQRAAPPLVFNKLNLLIENHWRHHLFALQALPPEKLSARLDLRGNFYGRSFRDLKAWEGELYTQLEYADVAAWRPWVPLPSAFRRGKGALRSWLGFADGKMKQLTADVALADVRTQLADGVLPLDLRTMRGRVGWKDSAQGIEVSTNQLSLRTGNVVLPPTDFYLRYAKGAEPGLSGGEIRANTLKLANLASLTDFLPLNHELKMKLAEFAPHGTVSGLSAKWQGEKGKPMHYEVKAKFRQLSMRRTEKLPGFSGLSGELSGTDATGTLALDTHGMTLDAPGIMPEALEFDRLSAQASWRKDEDGMEMKFSDVRLSNKDVAGVVFGSFQTQPDSLGIIDLNINLTRGDVGHTERYIPVAALDQETHEWLRSALLAGHADEFHLRIKGDLDDFPYPENKKGIFQVQARVHGVEFEYSKEWPRINDITGELLIQGKRLEVTATDGESLGGRLNNVSVRIPDTGDPGLMAYILGNMEGDTSGGLAYIQKSPIRSYIDGFTDGMSARGKGKLNLRVAVPLNDVKRAKVSGSYHFLDNELDMGNNIPILYGLNGDLHFTESSVLAKGLQTRVLGGPAALDLQTGANGELQATAHGKSDMDAWREYASYPALSRLHGGSDWDASIIMQKKDVNVQVSTNLAGMASALPAPFSKERDEVVPLHFEIRSVDEDQDMVSLQYGDLLDARLLRRRRGGDMVVRRGVVHFGEGEGRMRRRGVWVTGTIPYFSLEGWGDLLFPSGGGSSAGEADSTGAPFNIAGMELAISKLVAYGHSVDNLHIHGRGRNGVLMAQLEAKEINGEVSWQSRDEGKLVAHLRNLALGGGEVGGPELTAREPAVEEASMRTEFPALDLTVDDLTWKDKQLGKMELQAQQHGSDWLLESMRIANPEGVLTAAGKYHVAEGKRQTQVKLKLEISNAGKILTRYGYPNSVKNGSGKLEADFSWRGSPDDFSYAALDGTLNLDTGKGQFLQIDPGIGKLLGILSLQALPRHITLDFTDVFSKGFAFDSIKGTAQIRQGVLNTGDFRIEGSAAKVTMAGQVDLSRETQNLKVRILPTVGNSVSMLGAFTGGPLVGLGTFIVNKILRDPLDKLVSFEYNVSGTWADPKVVKLGQQQVSKQEEFNP